MFSPLRRLITISALVSLAGCAAHSSYRIEDAPGHRTPELDNAQAFAAENAYLAQQRLKVGLPPTRMTAGHMPAMPLEAIRFNVVGIVKVRVKFDEYGKPVSITQIGTAPDLLWKAVYDAVSTWRVEPVVVAGKAQPVLVQQEFVFSISD